MDLRAYLDRIAFSGPVAPDLTTLRALHRAHLMAVPYEGFDVLFGNPMTIDPKAAWAKIVERRRGGWCFEMNGTFGLALEEIGFKVTRLAGGGAVNDAPAPIGNHLVLRVELDEPWIADVGFSDGPVEPFRFAEGSFQQRGFDFRVEFLEDGFWRLHNHHFGAVPYYDCGPTDEAALAHRCDYLQTSPDSHFVNNVIAFHHNEAGYCSLIGRMLRTITPAGVQKRLVDSPEDLVVVLDRHFDLVLPEAAALWPAICARHDFLFPPAEAAPASTD